MINPLFLRSFCTLVETGHFTRTAEQLHMTQSGVSQHVRKLEEQLSRPLLVRRGKGFTLTEAGDRLYREAQDILLALSNLEQRVVEDSAFAGAVRVRSPGSVGLKLYPQLLSLQERHPQLAIDYRFAPNAEVEVSIANSDANIGFMTTPSNLVEVKSTPIADEDLYLVTPTEIKTPSWESLLELGFIDHPDGTHHAGLLLKPNYSEFQNKAQFKCSGFSNQISMILEPVSRGLGFTVLPAFAIEAFAHKRLIRVHRLQTPVSETVYLCTHAKKVNPARVDTVIAEIRKWL